MNIRPKIPIYLLGNIIKAPQWYIDRYGGRTSLLNWNLDKRYNYADENLNLNDHRNAGDLNTVYRKNIAYTGTPGAVSSDILAFYNSDGNGMSAEDFVKFYNDNASKIRNHWAANLTYNESTAGDHNRLFRRMFLSRSNLNQSPGSDYNIGYQEGTTKGGYDILDIEGSSTWLRRMDQYENEFDPNNPDINRIHEITLKDGTKARVYKKANGDIALLNKPTENSISPNDVQNGQNPIQGTNQGTGGGIPASQRNDPESLWSKIGANLNKIAPDLLDALRLAGNMHNNERVYRESMKAIIPNLLQSYHTYRQVVGDEATKLAYYRRAAQGQTQAARPFTSDADRQIAYQMEAKRVGDELRAQGDLADNQRIRETSAESAAHADANTERDTAVANSNLTELIKAKAAKHQLTALKYSADWSNIEQYLMGKLYLLEKKKAELKELERQLALLDTQEGLLGDDRLRELRDIADRDYTAYINYTGKDENEKETLKKRYEESIKAYKLYQILKSRENIKLQYGVYSAKEGTKIERKHKDESLKYLYKTSKDIVEHFRKMSKMTDDSRVRTMPKPIKLPSHPKKFLYGGVAPFTVYRPLGVGGESSYAQSTTSSSGSGKSEKDTAAKDKLDMIKELFKNIKGLPVDVAKVYQDIMGTLNKAKAFGEELSTDDLASMYLSSMQKMALLKYSEDAYEKAKALATLNEALNEIAVGTSGEMVFLNLNTGEYKIGTIGSKMFKDKEWNPLTNDLILELRAKSPNMVFNDLMFNIVNNGVGLNKISAEIKSLAAGLSTNDRKIEGISEVQNNRVKAGLLILAGVQGTPDGYYKVTLDSKDSRANVDAALNYIYSVLPTNYKTILAIHSGSEENSKGLILKYLTSQAHNSYEESISPLTGKASNSENSGGKGGNITPAMALSMGLGERETFTIADKTSDGLKVSAVNLPILDANHNPLAIATLHLVGNGDYAGQLQLNSATMGGVKISPEGINNILISEGRIHAAELPVDKQALLLGIIKPDLNFLKNIEIADLQIKEAGITNRDNLTPEQVNIINSIYTKNGLPMIYSIGANGPVLTSEYRRFAMMKATAPQEAFEEDLTFNDGVVEASEDDRNRFESMMKQVSGNSKYSLDNGISVPFFGRLSGTDLYKGIIYIPMSESHISALASTGFSASPEKYNEIDALDLLALFIKSSGYKNPGSWTK